MDCCLFVSRRLVVRGNGYIVHVLVSTVSLSLVFVAFLNVKLSMQLRSE